MKKKSNCKRRIKKALYDAGVACLIKKYGGMENTLKELEITKAFRTKKQTFDLKEKIIEIGDRNPEEFLEEIM